MGNISKNIIQFKSESRFLCNNSVTGSIPIESSKHAWREKESEILFFFVSKI